MKRIFYSLALTACLLPSFADAANQYVRIGATGLNNGSDWANAYTKLPTTLNRGDTYYLAGGSYGAYVFSTANSGTTPITVKKATAGDHGTNTGWTTAYGDSQATFSSWTFNSGYWVVDGATGGGPGNWESNFGFFVNMPASGGQAAAVRFGSGVSNITVKHTDFFGRGRSYGSDTDIFYIVNPLSNLTISHCLLRDTSRTMILTWPAGTNGITIEYSKFARNGNAEHREAWSAGPDSNVTVRHNLFEDILGTGVIAIVNNQGTASNWNIYGNIFYHTGKYSDGILNTGVLFNRYDGGGSPIAVLAKDWHVYNNIVANIRNGSFTAAFVSESSSNYVVENNIWFNNSPTSTGAVGVTVADYNWFYANGKNGLTGSHDVVGSSNPFVDAQPWLTGNWNLKAPIQGIPLAAPYNVDWNGAVRGADGVWDRGAIEYGSQQTSILPPSNLQVK
jgi:hypothetical protein